MKPLHLLLGIPLLLIGCSQTPPLLASINHSSSLYSQSTRSQEQPLTFHSTAILHIPQVSLVPQALQALKRLQTQTRAESGNRTFVAHQDQQNPQTILIWEEFDSETAFQKHLQSPHLQEFLKLKLMNFVQGYSASKPTSHLPVMSQGYFSTALLSLQPGQNLVQTQKAFAELEAQTRQEPGSRAFSVFSVQSEGKPAFVIWEYFKDEAAFQVHLNSSHLKSFLALNLVKFEKGYTVQPIK